MTNRAYSIYRYEIPVDSQLILRNRFLKKRRGLLVKVQCGNKVGWGEIAPLPEFSAESLDEAQVQTIEWLEKWNLARSHNEFLSLENLFPSVEFGLSCALAEMAEELIPEGNYAVAPLCYGDPDELFTKLHNLSGEKIAKVKVGMYEANRDGMMVNMLLEAVPDLQLRLDANCAWTLEKALKFAQTVNPNFYSRIQFLEEPCKSPELSVKFAEITGIKIAWDESIRHTDFDLNSFPYNHPQVSHLVIKPTLVGSINKCVALINQCKKLGKESVISSAIESSFGLSQLACISKQYTQTTAGLDTLNLMEYQLVRPWQGSELPMINLDNSEFVQLVAHKDFV